MSGFTRCCITLALLLCCSTWALPATILVDQAGGGDYLTISEGAAAASSGDTILVAPGTYSGPLNRSIWATYKTFMSEAGPDVTIVDCEFQDKAFHLENSTLSGFTVRNGDRNDALVVGEGDDRWGSIVHIRSCDVSQCVIEDCTYTAMEIVGNSAVTNCVFRRNSDYAVWMYSWGAQSFTGCLFEDNAKGMWIFDIWEDASAARSPRSYTISDCIFRGNGSPTIEIFCTGPMFADCVFAGNHGPVFAMSATYYADVRRCTFVDNDAPGKSILEFDYSSYFPNDCLVLYNIFAFNRCKRLYSGSLSNSEFLSNCHFNPEAEYDTMADNPPPYENIATDPLFCGLESGDYALCADSPCLAENEPVGFSMGAYWDAPGCPACFSAVEQTSWGAIKALYRGSRGR